MSYRFGKGPAVLADSLTHNGCEGRPDRDTLRAAHSLRSRAAGRLRAPGGRDHPGRPPEGPPEAEQPRLRRDPARRRPEHRDRDRADGSEDPVQVRRLRDLPAAAGDPAAARDPALRQPRLHGPERPSRDLRADGAGAVALFLPDARPAALEAGMGRTPLGAGLCAGRGQAQSGGAAKLLRRRPDARDRIRQPDGAPVQEFDRGRRLRAWCQPARRPAPGSCW